MGTPDNTRELVALVFLILPLLSTFLQVLVLFILRDLRARISKLEDRAMNGGLDGSRFRGNTVRT